MAKLKSLQCANVLCSERVAILNRNQLFTRGCTLDNGTRRTRYVTEALGRWWEAHVRRGHGHGHVLLCDKQVHRQRSAIVNHCHYLKCSPGDGRWTGSTWQRAELKVAGDQMTEALHHFLFGFTGIPCRCGPVITCCTFSADIRDGGAKSCSFSAPHSLPLTFCCVMTEKEWLESWSPISRKSATTHQHHHGKCGKCATAIGYTGDFYK